MLVAERRSKISDLRFNLEKPEAVSSKKQIIKTRPEKSKTEEMSNRKN